MNIKKIPFKILDRYNQSGFAIPQILVLSIGLALGISGLLSVAINKLNSTRLRSVEMQAKNASESGIFTIRALFNNSKTRAYNYFWLTKSCSKTINDNDCPSFYGGKSGKEIPGNFIKGSFHNLSNLYWPDVEWCDGIQSPTCIGRQVAPKCSYHGQISSKPIPWNKYIYELSRLIDEKDDLVGIDLQDAQKDYYQSFSIKSTEYIGSENNGENSILIEGVSKKSNDSKIKIGSNKARVNFDISKTIPPEGFAFISAGENERDTNSLYLGNLNVIGDKQGSIIWRKNIYSSANCNDIKNSAGIISSTNLPNNGLNKGGLWIQPLWLPSRPKISNKPAAGQPGPWSLGHIVCTPKSSWYSWSNCRFFETSGWDTFKTTDRTAYIDTLISKGKDAFFGVVTSDKSRLTLVFKGSIDISNGGRICHRHGSRNASCGSGKPENLTILFEQKKGLNKNIDQELECSSNGGMQVRTNQYEPQHSFVLSSTGPNYKESFSGFIYAPNTTFSTATQSFYKNGYYIQLPFYQKPNQGSKLLVTVKGSYAYLNDPEARSYDARSPRLIRTPSGRIIPFMSHLDKVYDIYMKDLYIIAVGQLCNNCEPGLSTMLNMALVWDANSDLYSLRGLNILANEAQLVDRNVDGKLWYVNLGRTPFSKSPKGNSMWIEYYGIKLGNTNIHNENIYIKGAAWMKNICFDRNKIVNWKFDNDFSKKLENRYSAIGNYNYGVPYYRGKSIRVWDTLREFN